jgi:hypothetical protein
MRTAHSCSVIISEKARDKEKSYIIPNFSVKSLHYIRSPHTIAKIAKNAHTIQVPNDNKIKIGTGKTVVLTVILPIKNLGISLRLH